MNQRSLFDIFRRKTTDPQTEQEQQLERVSGNIAPHILEFRRIMTDSIWNATALHTFVRERRAGTAPASADRVLRDLRKRGHLNYKIINRRKSLYQFCESTD